MNYKLIAADMDNTVLDRKKDITPRTLRALHAAAEAGCEIVFTTGRSCAEVRKYYTALPELRYFIGNTGACIMDMHTGRLLYSCTIGDELCASCVDVFRPLDCMVTVHAGELLYVDERVRKTLAYYGADIYETLFNETGIWVPDIFDLLREKAADTYKLDLFFHSHDDQVCALERLKALPVGLSSGSITNIEITPAGTSKGASLHRLAEQLGIDMRCVIACGDANNDMSMVTAAGLGVAMGNASEELRAAAQIITADCDHDGVGEIIERYILSE